MKACMLAYSFFDTDNRVRRYARTLVSHGFEVDVVSLRRDDQKAYDEIDGLKVYRIQSRKIDERGELLYFWRILKFVLWSALFVSWKHIREPYDLIHVHSIPDFEVFATLIPKLTGTRILLDIHDLVPELYCSKFRKRQGSFIFKVLVLQEKLSSSFADHVISANHIWQKKLIERSVSEQRCSVMLNYPESAVFYDRQRKRLDGKFVIIYPGTLNWHQGIDVAIKAFSIISKGMPNAEFHIYGEGPSKPALMEMVKELHLEDRVQFRPMQPILKIAEIMSEADIGIVPKRNDFFGGEAFSTKILEFMALGVPVIVSRTKIDAHYFNDSIVRFFEPEDEKDLAIILEQTIRDENLRRQLASNARDFVSDLTWDKKEKEYLALVEKLVKRE